MSHLTRVLSSLLVPCLGACSFDLTEIVPDARDPQLSVELITEWGGTAALEIRLDPGGKAGGSSRMSADDSVVIRGAKHGPTAVEEGVWSYNLTDLGDDAGPIPVVLPRLDGVEGPLALSIPMFRIEAPDTLRAPPGGVLSIDIVDHDPSWTLQQGSWRLTIFGQGSGRGPLLAIAGYGQAAVLHVPVMILPPGVTAGTIDVVASSGYSGPGLPFPINIRLHATALIPFRIDVE